jgi:D-alanine-D-alanine ligase
VRITVLTYVEGKERSTEYDVVVNQVARALRRQGHQVAVLGVHADVKRVLAGLQRRRPDLVFNLVEMFAENMFGDIAMEGLLDLLGLEYTGCGPGESYLTQDKALSKKLLAFHGILYPRFAVFARDADFETGGNLRMPLFVKPLRTDASIGIRKNSLVTDMKSLMRRVATIHDELNDSALAEEYIEGREFYVGVLGNYDPIALPPIELDFSGLPEGAPHVLDSKAKWDENSAEYKGTKAVLADLPDELRAKLQKVSVDAYRALRVRDYGRVDLRLTDTGEIYVLEVNASCYLARDSEFAMAAAAAGIPYPALIQRIVDLATDRYRRGAGLRSRTESGKKTPDNGRKGGEGGKKSAEEGKKPADDGKKGAESVKKAVEA